MDNIKRFISLKTKIIISTLIPVIICFSIISSVNFSLLFTSLNEAAKAEFLQVGQKYTQRFEGKINEAMNYMTILASILELQVKTGNSSREDLQREVLQIFNDYKLIDGSSVYFEPNMYDGRDAEYKGSEYGTATSGRICWYYYVDGGKTVYTPEAIGDDVEFELPHYLEAKNSNKPIYTNPVTHKIDGKDITMFTLTYPLRGSGDRFIGAITVDLFLEDIYTQLQQEQIYETGYIIIANDNDKVIYSPDFQDIGKSREEVGLHYTLPSENEKTVFFNAKSILNGKRTLITIDSIYIPQLDSLFYFSVAAPIEEINASAFRLMTSLIMFSVLAVAVIAFLLYYLIGRIAAPIKDITDNVDKIAGGDYNARIQGDYKGEFAVVKDSVNAMAESIGAYVEESKNSLDILKNILNGLGAYIYVTVPSTGELLFMNEKSKDLFQIEGEGAGHYCYKILHEGMNGICDFCPCHRLNKEPDKAVEWETYNAVTKRYYRNTDCYIDWHGGVKAHLQHAVDITDIKTVMLGKSEAERAALEMKHEKEKAEEAAKAKNDFLAKMSHEIRTPMNAVMGMSELILRKELPQDVYENALGIKSASINLLSIINDILDFSKIESGMMEIVETNYLFPSLINDVIGIIRIRLIDKPVQFVVNIAPDIPAALRGDEIRIRQMLINLLSNAVKYTNRGHISLTVTGVVSGNTVTLTMDVADTGIGVKEENIGKLFGDFVQIDTIKNKGIEGTGLGLSISRSFCEMMGGNITLKSEYGKGSTFSVTLPQEIELHTPFASINDLDGKSILLYETRQVYRESLIGAFESLGIEYKSVDNIPSLFDNLEKYPYVFISSFMYGSINLALLEMDNPPKIVLLADITETLAPRDVRILAMPAHSLSIANILEDNYEGYGRNSVTGASFIAHEAKVLLVDDVTANLKVGEGLLLPYEMQVTLCADGRDAIGLVATNRYDLIFMDHMMPEMDGLEVTRHIREMEGEYFATVPIIALTANAVSGVREMFVQNGMNDFLSKPIETAKLDAILEKWVPKEKRKKIKAQEQPEEKSDFVDMLRTVPEISVDKALSVVGDSCKTFERIVRLSVRLLPENIARLDELIDTSLQNYAIEVHGIKGVLNNMGAYELGTEAFGLEQLSKNGDLDSCKALHPNFIQKLAGFSGFMQNLLDKTATPAKPEGDISFLLEAIPQLEEAADFFDNASALKVLSSIDQYTYGQEADKFILDLTRAFEYFDFDRTLELIDEWKGELNKNG